MGKTLLLGHYGGDNIGDDAMLNAVLNAESLNQMEFNVMVKKDVYSSIYRSNRIRFIEFSLTKLFRLVNENETLLIGGGTHYEDTFRSMRYIRHFRFILFFSFVTILFYMLGKKVVWLGLGIGPINRSSTRLLLKMAARNTDLITLRDFQSYSYLEYLKNSKNVQLTFDLAALVDFQDNSDVSAQLKNNPKILGISLTNVKNRNTDISGLYDLISQGLLKLLLESNDLIVRIFVFRGGQREDDNYESQILFKKLDKEFHKRVEIIQYTTDLKKFLKIFNECGYFICSRYHSALLAYMNNSNLLLLPYHQKLYDLAEEIKLHRSALVRKEENKPELIMEKLRMLLSDDTKFKAKLDTREAKSRALKNIQLLQKIV